MVGGGVAVVGSAHDEIGWRVMPDRTVSKQADHLRMVRELAAGIHRHVIKRNQLSTALPTSSTKVEARPIVINRVLL